MKTMTPKTITNGQRRQILEFVRDCKTLGLSSPWACLTVSDLRGTDAKQLRRAKSYFAIAHEPMLENFVILTRGLKRVNLTPEELRQIEKQGA
jgi:hypothetical protein